jgi:hypothetical protein
VSGSCHIIVPPTIFRAAPNETLKFPVEPPSLCIKKSVLISSPRLRFARSSSVASNARIRRAETWPRNVSYVFSILDRFTAAKSLPLPGKTQFWAVANTENDTLRLHGGRSSTRTLRTASVFETALLGRPEEKSDLSVGYSPPYGESLAPLEMRKRPFMPPNGVI